MFFTSCLTSKTLKSWALTQSALFGPQVTAMTSIKFKVKQTVISKIYIDYPLLLTLKKKVI